jgi:tryptophan-rich sensory protein
VHLDGPEICQFEPFVFSVVKPVVKPEIYQWSSVTVSGILAVTSLLFLLFGASSWYNVLNKPMFSLPLGVLSPFQAVSVFLAGFGARIVMGNVSGNPAVTPARKLFGIWLSIHGVWLVVFAALHLPVLSLGIAAIQWGVATLCIQKFYNVDPRAGSKVTPLYIMTTYWMLLNGYIVGLNNL